MMNTELRLVQQEGTLADGIHELPEEIQKLIHLEEESTKAIGRQKLKIDQIIQKTQRINYE